MINRNSHNGAWLILLLIFFVGSVAACKDSRGSGAEDVREDAEVSPPDADADERIPCDDPRSGEFCGDPSDDAQRCLQWTCIERTGLLACRGPEPNLCGGCARLDGRPGARCDAAGGGRGRWTCEAGGERVRCEADPAVNACGGLEPLEGDPGDTCGVCGDGRLACQGQNALVCGGATPANACGGCGAIDAPLGESCGCDDGTWECSEDLTRAECTSPTQNQCAGCGVLEGVPGERCEGACGESTWICTAGGSAVRCPGTDANACGGCETLVAQPGAECTGPCGRGVQECTAQGTLRCSAERNACGTCADLGGAPGDVCEATCGAGLLQCSPDGQSLVCVGPETNICGGCTQIEGALNDACGCGGRLRCVFGDLACVGGAPTNACGGCSLLPGTEGSGCSTATVSCGVWRCNGSGGMTCEPSVENSCGGCGELQGVEGESCGCGGVWSCLDEDTLFCEGGEPNVCGGCATLSGRPGQLCGACGSLVCDGKEALRCEDEGTNACGGCEPLESAPGLRCEGPACGFYACAPDRNSLFCLAYPSSRCAACGPGEGQACGQCGTQVCSETGEMVCVERELNACGGCAPLTNPPGTACGPAGLCGRYVCAEDGLTTFCTDTGRNACGGCGPLPERLGTTCGDCGTIVCDGEQDVRCDDEGFNACGSCSSLLVVGGDQDTQPEQPCGGPCGVFLCNEAGDVLECVERPQNACGGCGFLDREPGASCGTCGRVRCMGNGVTACVEDVNACGGCEDLGPFGAFLGQQCQVNGIFVCGPDKNTVVCDDRGLNVCGGFDALEGRPGDACGRCGTLVCEGTESLTCREFTNACGGCEDLGGILPGIFCSGATPCASYQCGPDGESIACTDQPTNACGGCFALIGEPGTSCSECGTWTCQGSETVSCAETTNECGGCGPLVGEPGAPCGDCGVYVCRGGNLVCEGGELNVCGGCAPLPGEVGEDCGTCGTWGCGNDPDNLVCFSDTVNLCGGCESLGVNVPGRRCGVCAGDRLVCEGLNSTRCQEVDRNACGGCGTLPQEIGSMCPCGVPWECFGTSMAFCPGLSECGACDNDPANPLPPLEQVGSACVFEDGSCGVVTCSEDGLSTFCAPGGVNNACGGCFQIPPGRRPGDACRCGVYVCDGPDSTVCPGQNNCGGCSPLELDDQLGDSCNEGCGVWECFGRDEIICSGSEFNVCGGCFTIDPAQLPGEECACGEYICDPAGSGNTVCPNQNICGGCTEIPNSQFLNRECEDDFSYVCFLDDVPPERRQECLDTVDDVGCGINLCSDDNTELVCTFVLRNGCGGCERLPEGIEELIGQPCPCGGVWTCEMVTNPETGEQAPTNDVICPGANACGGCETLPGVPGQPCADGYWYCNGPNELSCR